MSGTQAWSSFGSQAWNAVAWQCGASGAAISAWIILPSSMNISNFSPSATTFENIYFSKNKHTTEVSAEMETVSGGKRSDYEVTEQVTLPEHVRLFTMLLLVLASYIDIEYYN